MLTKSVAMTRSKGEVLIWTAPSGLKRICRFAKFVPAGTLRPRADDDDDVFKEDRIELAHPLGGTVIVKLETVRVMTLEEAMLTLDGKSKDAERIINQKEDAR